MTQRQLAERMNLKEPSVSHHLGRLSEAGLIQINRSEVGPYGILQKYYEPTARLFIEDWDSIPPELHRYFIHAHMERLRGMFSVFQLIEGDSERLDFDGAEMEAMAELTARRISKIAETYEGAESALDRENLLIRIYSETLRAELRNGRLLGAERSGAFSRLLEKLGLVGEESDAFKVGE
jgi:DNA-binding transcriptional ArsR family regulator